jgi:hypothetical protein
MQKVLQGQKTQTRRTSNRRYTAGKTYAIRVGMLQRAQAKITVLRTWRQQLRDLTPEDVKKEGFTSFTEFRQAWISIYGSWSPDQYVTAIEFRLLTSARTGKPSPAAASPQHEPKKQA